MNEKKQPPRQFELSRLTNSSDTGIKDRTLSEGFKDGGKVPNSTTKIDTKSVQNQLSGNDFVEKIAKLRALKGLGQKAMGVIPFAGAGYAALSGDPAMAADELAGDVPVLGQAYEAIKPSDSGNVEEERQMIAERNAQVDYNNSPAKLARLKALQGFGR